MRLEKRAAKPYALGLRPQMVELMSNKITQLDIDEIWRTDGERNGWQLPSSVPVFFTLLGVRHVRAAYHEKRARNRASRLKKQGIGLGVPPQRELWVVYAIARGWC